MEKDKTPLLIVIGSSSFFLLLMVVLALIGNSLGWFDFLFEDDDKSSPSPSTNPSRQSSPSSTASRSAGSQSAGSQSAGSQSAGSQSAGSQSAGTGSSTGTSGGSSFDYPSTPAGETCNIAACNQYMYENIVKMPSNSSYVFETSSTGTNACRGCPKRKYTVNGIVENVEINGQIINMSTVQNPVRQSKYTTHTQKNVTDTAHLIRPVKMFTGTPDDCKTFCDIIPGCEGFSQTHRSLCIFKNNLSSFINNPSTMDDCDYCDMYLVADTKGNISYPRVKHSSNKYQMHLNKDVIGSDLKYEKYNQNEERVQLTSSADDCKAVCDGLSVCGGFSYHRSDNTCYLKDNTLASQTPTSDQTLDTYIKQPGTFCNADACNRFIHNNINNDTAFARTDEFAEGPCKKCPSRGYVHNGTTRTLLIDDVPTDVTQLSKLQRYDMAKLSPY